MVQEIIKEKVKAWLNTKFEVVWGDENTQKLIGETVADLIPVVQQKHISDMISRIMGEIRSRTY